MAKADQPPPVPVAGKIRLLVIDDDRKLCRLIRDYLGPLGYEVETAHTGPDGLERALGGGWQAVILDVMLPGMDGFEVLKRLRRGSAVPVLSLARARGRVKTREQLLDEIRERNYEAFDRSIDVHISALRRKLGDDPKAPAFIRTVRTAGYLLINPDDDPEP